MLYRDELLLRCVTLPCKGCMKDTQHEMKKQGERVLTDSPSLTADGGLKTVAWLLQCVRVSIGDRS